MYSKMRGGFTTNSTQGGISEDNRYLRPLEPFSLSVGDAAKYFGFNKNTIYNMISNGTLILGTHYLKVGRKVVILTAAFKKWMFEQSGILAPER